MDLAQAADDKGLVSVLLVEDERSDARLISTYVRDLSNRVDITHCLDLSDALVHTGQHFDVILTDLNLPDSHGTLTVQSIAEAFPGRPIVAMTIDEVDGVECIKAGANDFLPKSELDRQHLLRTINFTLSRAKHTVSLEHQSTHDQLTGLLNRQAFANLATATLGGAESSQQFFLAFFDVDGFKEINDSFGHPFGDTVLSTVAAALRDSFRSSDVVGRWGGDEFVVFGHWTSSTNEQMREVGTGGRMTVTVASSEGPLDSVDLSCGAVHLVGGSDFETAIAEADHRMYASKATHSPEGSDLSFLSRKSG